jgi:hypothetical protein
MRYGPNQLVKVLIKADDIIKRENSQKGYLPGTEAATTRSSTMPPWPSPITILTPCELRVFTQLVTAGMTSAKLMSGPGDDVNLVSGVTHPQMPTLAISRPDLSLRLST